MQKKAENTFSISKFIQKNIKKGKKKAHLFGFFPLLYPLCILNLKIHIKKDKNAKKSIKIFSNCKNKHAKKKHEIIFLKKMQKKAEMQKKGCKKRQGVYIIAYQRQKSKKCVAYRGPCISYII